LKNSQIESIEAGKITGQLNNEQIKEIEAAKIAGQLSSSQIKELEAAKIVGQLVAAQLAKESVTTAKLAAESVTAGKIAANAITAEKILAESITSVKIAAGAILAEKIAAGAVTAEKINVKELSAIAVNAGTITAGTFKGVTFETTNGRTTMNNEGLALIAPKIGESGPTNRIEWYKEKLKGTLLAELVCYRSESGGTTFMRLQANAEEETGVSQMTLGASHPTVSEKNKEANIILEATKTVTGIIVEVAAVKRTIFNSEGKSHFLQLPQAANRGIIFGAVNAKGETLNGEGFTVTNTATGKYTLKLKEELPLVGALFVEINGSFTQVHKSSGPSKKEWTIEINGFNFSVPKLEAANEPFSFWILPIG
jgi:hypothetical protein